MCNDLKIKLLLFNPIPRSFSFPSYRCKFILYLISLKCSPNEFLFGVYCMYGYTDHVNLSSINGLKVIIPDFCRPENFYLVEIVSNYKFSIICFVNNKVIFRISKPPFVVDFFAIAPNTRFIYIIE